MTNIKEEIISINGHRGCFYNTQLNFDNNDSYDGNKSAASSNRKFFNEATNFLDNFMNPLITTSDF